MKALFGGTCKNCGNAYNPGDDIITTEDGVKHETCMAVVANTVIHARLEEIRSHIRGFNEDLEFFDSKYVDPVVEEQSQCASNAALFKEEWEEHIRRLRQEYEAKIQAERDRWQELNTKLIEVNGLKDRINNSLRELSIEEKELLAQLAAQERIDELKAGIGVYLTQTIWGAKARDYQVEDILFILDAYKAGKTGVLNMNGMGFGKTLETAAAINILDDEFYKEYDRKPLKLWLTKKSLTGSNRDELLKWLGDYPIVVLIHPDRSVRSYMLQMGLQMNAMFITNYEALRTMPELHDVPWDFLFADEVHKLKGGANKSGPTQVWDAAYSIAKNMRFRLLLSGTPAKNRIGEMYAYVKIFVAGTHLENLPGFKTLSGFESEFCYRFDGTVDVDRLLTVLKGQFIRQDPNKIDLNRGEKIVEDIWIEMTDKQREVYDKVKDALIMELKEADSNDPDLKLNITNMLSWIMRLRQVNVWAPAIKYKSPLTGIEATMPLDESSKVDETMDMVTQLLTDGEQVIVWSTFNDVLDEIVRRTHKLGSEYGNPRAQTITGATKDAREVEKDFQQGRIQVLAANIRSANEGFNFHKNQAEWPGGSRHAIFLDLWWAPADNEQAEDRIWRPGSTGANIYRIFNKDSVDLFFLDLIAKKLGELSVLDDKALRPGEWADYLEGMI